MAEEKTYKKIDDLQVWSHNPRSITKENYQRLKNQIKRFGQYKPLIVNKSNVVIGGNMRLRAYKEMGLEDIWVTVVDAETEAKMLEYAMSDNSNLGDWDEEQLTELLTGEWTNLDTPQDFVLDTGKLELEKLLEKFGPGEEEEPPLNDKDLIECPNCHHKFESP